MKNIGIVGFGSMGSMLLEAFLRTGAVPPSRVVLHSRSPLRYSQFSANYPEVVLVESIPALVKLAEYVFVCVPPGNVKEVLEQIQRSKNKDTVVISLAASVTLDCLSSVVGVQVSRLIPNITAEVDEGVFLVCHGQFLSSDSGAFIERILSYIGTVYPISEDQVEIYTDLTSCAPGILSRIFSLFVESAEKFGRIDQKIATEMFVSCIYGTAKVYKNRGLSFEDMIKRVARPGGVTEVGISVLSEKLPPVLDEVFEKTMQNHQKKKKKMEEDYGLALH